jgi:hypothetical protein
MIDAGLDDAFSGSCFISLNLRNFSDVSLQQPAASVLDNSTNSIGRLGDGNQRSLGRECFAIVWLIAFLVFFYSLTPPNNPDSPRYKLWPQVPFLLLDSIDPPTEANRPPSGWSYFPQRFDLILVAAIILAGAWGTGHLCLRLIGVELEPWSAERTVFAFAIGLAALSLLTLLCGTAGLLSRGLFAAVIGAAVVAECILRIRDRRRHSATSPAGWFSGRISDRLSLRSLGWLLLFAVTVPFLLSMFLGAMLPSTDFDVREYHLQGPKEFYQAGKVSFLPHNVYTSFPFLTEMLSLLAMVFRGDWYRGALAGKVVLMCFGPLTALALYAAGRCWFSPAAGWLAAVIYLTIPWTFRISTIAYAEGGLSFYLFVSLLAIAMAVARLRDDRLPHGQLLLCGLLSGSAMACKYTGVVSVVVPLLVVTGLAPYVLRLPAGRRSRAAWQTTGVFILGTTIAVGPWLVKNLLETGNPVYPLMYSVFDGEDWDAALNAKWRAAHSPHNFTDLPQRVLEVTAGNDWLSPLLFGLAPLSLLSIAGRRVGRYVWLYVGWLFFTWWALTHRLDRFWVPTIPVVSVLAGIGAASVGGRVWRIVLGIGIFTALLFNLTYITTGQSGYSEFLIDLDYSRESAARAVPPDIAYLNDNLPPGSRVLMVGEAQVFDARFPLVYNTVFDHSIFQQWCAIDDARISPGELPLRNSDDIHQRLRDEGITHICVNWQEILRYRTTYRYTDFVTPARFVDLQQFGILGPAVSLVVRIDEKLRQQLDGERKQWTPSVQKTSDGSQLLIYNKWDELADEDRQEIEKWAPSLLRTVNGRQMLTTSQIYKVLP